MNWTIDDLKNDLSAHTQITQWRIIEKKTNRKERYFLNDQDQAALDQDRSSKSSEIRIEVFTKKNSDKLQGQAKLKLFPRQPLKEQIDHALDIAEQVEVETWKYPETIETSNRQIASFDPLIKNSPEQVMNELSQNITTKASSSKKGQFNSSELFLSEISQDLTLSNGLHYPHCQTQIYAEAAYSGRIKQGNSFHSDEFLKTVWCVEQSQLHLEELFNEAEDRSQAITKASLPESGRYSVLLHSDVLLGIFNSALGQLSAAFEYQRLPHKNKGDAFLTQSIKGDPINLSLDPYRDLEADSVLYSGEGVLQKPMTLIKDNVIENKIVTKQYGDYLNLAPTTSRGTLVIPPGKASKEALLSSNSKVLEVIQFSALFYNPVTCAFSSEIRLAKLHDQNSGKAQWIKGGSLSGSLFEHFHTVKFSKELGTEMSFDYFTGDAHSGQSYYGPRYALIQDVPVVS